MSGVLRVQYRVGSKERLFDVGQTVYANRRRILRKNGLTLRPYTKTIARMRTQSIELLALALFWGLLLWVGEPDTLMIVLLVMYAFCAILMPAAWYMSRKSYQKALQMYRTDHGEVGYILFDEEGMTDHSEKGNRTVLPWAEYIACVLTQEAVVLLFERPVLLILGRDAQTEQGIREALAAFGRANTVYEANVKESGK